MPCTDACCDYPCAPNGVLRCQRGGLCPGVRGRLSSCIGLPGTKRSQESAIIRAGLWVFHLGSKVVLRRTPGFLTCVWRDNWCRSQESSEDQEESNQEHVPSTCRREQKSKLEGSRRSFLCLPQLVHTRPRARPALQSEPTHHQWPYLTLHQRAPPCEAETQDRWACSVTNIGIPNGIRETIPVCLALCLALWGG